MDKRHINLLQMHLQEKDYIYTHQSAVQLVSSSKCGTHVLTLAVFTSCKLLHDRG